MRLIVGRVEREPIVREMVSRVVTRLGGELHAFPGHAGLLAASANVRFGAIVLYPRDALPIGQVRVPPCNRIRACR